MAIHISRDVEKLQGVPNYSLLPITTCDRGPGCTRPRPGAKGRPAPKCPQCYGVKAVATYPETRKAWTENTEAADNPQRFFGRLSGWFDFQDVTPEWFRIHVVGDCPSRSYVRETVKFCRQHLETRFLMFTKRYSWFNAYHTLPANLVVVYSAWPGWPMKNPHNRPVAWLRDSRQPDDRIPACAAPCPGKCEGCMVCWTLQRGRSVVFTAH